LGFSDRIPLLDVSGDSREVHMVVDIPDTPKLIELSFDEEPKECPIEDPEMGEPDGE